jgi:hypothetical protein
MTANRISTLCFWMKFIFGENVFVLIAEVKSLVSAKRTPSCKDSRRVAMLRHEQALKEGVDEVAKAGFRAGM